MGEKKWNRFMNAIKNDYESYSESGYVEALVDEYLDLKGVNVSKL